MLGKLAAKIFNWLQKNHMRYCDHIFTTRSRDPFILSTSAVCTRCGFSPCSHEDIQ